MNEFNEAAQVPVDVPPPRQEILAAITAKDYPRDIGFVGAVGKAIFELINGIGELLFGKADARMETAGGDFPPEARDYYESTERKAADIMAEVFDRNTLERWPAMDAVERQAKLEEYYYRLTDMLGIPATGLIVTDLNQGGSEGFTFGCFIPDTGQIYIDYRIFEDPNLLGQTLSTLTHETRHQFQQNVVENPGMYPDVPPVLVEVWTKNMPPPPSNYKDADTYGFEMYYSQPIEVDAESFAQSVMMEYVKIINV